MPGTQQQIATALYSKLSGDTGAGGVSTLVSARIYYAQASDDAALPLVIFNKVTDSVRSSFAEDVAVQEWQIDIYSPRASGVAACQTIADRCITLLNRVALTVSGWDACRTELIGDGIADIEEDACRIVLRFRLYAD